ncbi:MAG TPA: phenylalanine--tRNA ligase subunit alpha [Bacteroides sp.]|nr:phenylalanine--tRNA ligase subunit alpha [Bacteroides sp.]
MLEKIKKIKEEILSGLSSTQKDAESFRLRYLSKKGIISELFDSFKALPSEQKKQYGKKLNELKQLATQKLEEIRASGESTGKEKDKPDLTRPGIQLPLGTRHPVSIIRREIIDIFTRLGFVISEGPEIEDDWHVFSALNFPQDHPARDMQDTFFIRRNPDILLRTHTSSVQVRVMEKQQPPIRTISPGRVFRNEAISARAHCIFHQVEGLYIDEGVSFADMRQVLLYFAREMFGQETQIRLRPSFFPFTEPSAEMDISCSICGGSGCNVCKYSGWVEIMGCGMVDPNVLDNCNIDSEKYTGYAFGMGIERIAMLKYQVNDLRLYFENDKRFLDQFISAW